MERVRNLLCKMLHPPGWMLFSFPVLSFTALIAVFVSCNTETVSACLIYSASAYSLIIWIAALPGILKRIKSAIMSSRLMRKAAASKIVGRYLTDLAFRGTVSVYQGMIINFCYVVFRIIAGVRYTSVWFLSMAVYYLVLGGLRTYLIVAYRRRSPALEFQCYRRTAWLLFLLNVPMGGMIVLMVRTNSGFFYPGYIIYLSALYTFYTTTTSLTNLIKYRKLGSPILSAAKVLNLVSAMMSILGLQTAMISRFSEHGEDYRRMMNTITGGFVYAIVIFIAVSMLFRSRRKRVKELE